MKGYENSLKWSPKYKLLTSSKGFQVFRICPFCDAYVRCHQFFTLSVWHTLAMERESSPPSQVCSSWCAFADSGTSPLGCPIASFGGSCPQPPSLAVCFRSLAEAWNPLTGEKLCFFCRRVSPNPKLEPPRNVPSFLSHASLTPAWLVGSNLLFPGMNSNSTCISSRKVAGDVLWNTIQLWTSQTNLCLVCVYAQVIPRPWLVLLTKAWLTAWPSFWLP